MWSQCLVKVSRNLIILVIYMCTKVHKEAATYTLDETYLYLGILYETIHQNIQPCVLCTTLTGTDGPGVGVACVTVVTALR